MIIIYIYIYNYTYILTSDIIGLDINRLINNIKYKPL